MGRTLLLMLCLNINGHACTVVGSSTHLGVRSRSTRLTALQQLDLGHRFCRPSTTTTPASRPRLSRLLRPPVARTFKLAAPIVLVACSVCCAGVKSRGVHHWCCWSSSACGVACYMQVLLFVPTTMTSLQLALLGRAGVVGVEAGIARARSRVRALAIHLIDQTTAPTRRTKNAKVP